MNTTKMSRKYRKTTFQITQRMGWRTAVTWNYRDKQNSSEIMYELSGLVDEVLQEKQISESFRFREIVVIKDGPFPQPVILQFRNEKADLLAGITKGSEVTIKFDISGKVHVPPAGEKRWFNTLVGIDINKS